MNVPVKILIVEDEPDLREILKIQIQVIGYEVIETATGEEALERAVAEDPDLVIMDLALPGMSGLEAAVKLKADPKTAKIPVVAYTACPGDALRERAERVGMVAFVTKPAQPRQFREVIQKIVADRPLRS